MVQFLRWEPKGEAGRLQDQADENGQDPPGGAVDALRTPDEDRGGDFRVDYPGASLRYVEREREFAWRRSATSGFIPAAGNFRSTAS